MAELGHLDVVAVIASIPSPSSRFVVRVGPLDLRWYGLLIAVGAVVGWLLARRELRRRGIDEEIASTVALWTIPFGLVGARLYHVVTDYELFRGHLERVVDVTQGGLGLPGVIVGGAIGAAVGARRCGVRPLVMFDVIAPGLVAAQAIGRWGNYFNQELFGGPATTAGPGTTHRRIVDRHGVVYEYDVSLTRGTLYSVAVGFVSSFLGIGGGVIPVPLLAGTLGFPIHIATATSHFVLAIVSGAGTLTHLADGGLRVGTGLRRAVALSVGVIPGAQVGAAASRRLPAHRIQQALAVALIAISVRLLVAGIS